MEILTKNDKAVHVPTKELIELGKTILSENTVAIILLAGGQGTRLNFCGPKGLFPIPKFGTPFEIFLRKLQKHEKTFGLVAKLYVMTSEFTDLQTQKYFRDFYPNRKVFFFQQDSEVCMGNAGEPLFNENGIVKAPNGNGGVFKALRNVDLSHCKFVQIVSIDNVLANVFDPCSIGIMNHFDYDVLSKGVMKKEDENTGIFVKNRNIRVMEYSEIGKYCLECSKESISDCIKNCDKECNKDYDNNCTVSCDKECIKSCDHSCSNLCDNSSIHSCNYSANHSCKESYIHSCKKSNHSCQINAKPTECIANICNHYFKTEFLEKLKTLNLETHFAKKKIPCFIDGKKHFPETPNGIKKEFFIFDALKFTEKSGVLLVDRKKEFSPLKNSLEVSSDNVETCLADLEREFC